MGSTISNSCRNSIYFVLLVTTSFVSPLTFNLSTIGPDNTNREIKVQGDAYISREGLQVTTDESNRPSASGTGRATYEAPLHLWDNATGNLTVTDFDTHFSFLILSPYNSESGCTAADGLAFILAPFNSSMAEGSSGGGLGLAFPNPAANVSGDPFVAVEFDTFTNPWDPVGLGPHVGIDVDSLISAKYQPWVTNLSLPIVNQAWITYKSASQKLLVNFTDFWNNSTRICSIEYTIDLQRYLPELVSIGFSAATGVCFQKNNVKSWSFNSTLELQNKLNETPNVTSSNPISSPPKKKKGQLIGLVAGLSIVLLGAILLGFWLWSKKRRDRRKDEKDNDDDVAGMEMDFQKDTGPRRFSYGDLVVATDNFSEEFKLGEGGFGGVYKGFLQQIDSNVAVKRVSKSSKQGAKEYASEVKIISRLRHRNLVQLIGWCHEKQELLLVYELLPNGSLDSHLFNNKSSLNWETRYKIVKGLASALLYLHEEWEQCVVHIDIKSSNVMLDASFNAKLGDFGLARLVDHDKESRTTMVAGTMGYMAPECVMTGKASKESDVFSLGVVALEIATGRRPICNGARTVEWVWEMYGKGRHLEAADPCLDEYEEREMERLMVVGLWCAHPDDGLRPSVREVVQALAFEAQPPLLPPKMPVPTYSAPPPATIESLISATSTSTSIATYSYVSNATSSSSASASTSLLKSR